MSESTIAGPPVARLGSKPIIGLAMAWAFAIAGFVIVNFTLRWGPKPMGCNDSANVANAGPALRIGGARFKGRWRRGHCTLSSPAGRSLRSGRLTFPATVLISAGAIHFPLLQCRRFARGALKALMPPVAG